MRCFKESGGRGRLGCGQIEISRRTKNAWNYVLEEDDPGGTFRRLIIRVDSIGTTQDKEESRRLGGGLAFDNVYFSCSCQGQCF